MFASWWPAVRCLDCQHEPTLRPSFPLMRCDVLASISSFPPLCIGHGFGIIPVPGSFAASAFPAPPNKSSESAPKISRVPPEKQPLALGAVSSRSRVPQLQGQKRRNKTYQNRVQLIGYLGKNPEHKSVRASDRKYAVLSLATQRSWKGADEEWHPKTDWHRVMARNGTGDPARDDWY